MADQVQSPLIEEAISWADSQHRWLKQFEDSEYREWAQAVDRREQLLRSTGPTDDRLERANGELKRLGESFRQDTTSDVFEGPEYVSVAERNLSIERRINEARKRYEELLRRATADEQDELRRIFVENSDGDALEQRLRKTYSNGIDGRTPTRGQLVVRTYLTARRDYEEALRRAGDDRDRVRLLHSIYIGNPADKSRDGVLNVLYRQLEQNRDLVEVDLRNLLGPRPTRPRDEARTVQRGDPRDDMATSFAQLSWHFEKMGNEQLARTYSQLFWDTASPGLRTRAEAPDAQEAADGIRAMMRLGIVGGLGVDFGQLARSMAVGAFQQAEESNRVTPEIKLLSDVRSSSLMNDVLPSFQSALRSEGLAREASARDADIEQIAANYTPDTRLFEAWPKDETALASETNHAYNKWVAEPLGKSLVGSERVELAAHGEAGREYSDIRKLILFTLYKADEIMRNNGVELDRKSKSLPADFPPDSLELIVSLQAGLASVSRELARSDHPVDTGFVFGQGLDERVSSPVLEKLLPRTREAFDLTNRVVDEMPGVAPTRLQSSIPNPRVRGTPRTRGSTEGPRRRTQNGRPHRGGASNGDSARTPHEALAQAVGSGTWRAETTEALRAHPKADLLEKIFAAAKSGDELPEVIQGAVRQARSRDGVDSAVEQLMGSQKNDPESGTGSRVMAGLRDFVAVAIPDDGHVDAASTPIVVLAQVIARSIAERQQNFANPLPVGHGISASLIASAMPRSTAHAATQIARLPTTIGPYVGRPGGSGLPKSPQARPPARGARRTAAFQSTSPTSVGKPSGGRLADLAASPPPPQRPDGPRRQSSGRPGQPAPLDPYQALSQATCSPTWWHEINGIEQTWRYGADARVPKLLRGHGKSRRSAVKKAHDNPEVREVLARVLGPRPKNAPLRVQETFDAVADAVAVAVHGRGMVQEIVPVIVFAQYRIRRQPGTGIAPSLLTKGMPKSTAGATPTQNGHSSTAPPGVHDLRNVGGFGF